MEWRSGTQPVEGGDVSEVEPESVPRRKRVDAQRNVDALLAAAKAVFAVSGVDAPAKEVAGAAGVGVGTLYRHFPQRADLVVAVLQREIDACAEAATTLALDAWLERYAEFVATKHGLASALHSGDPAFAGLAASFWHQLGPALGSLLDAGAARGEIRGGVEPDELLSAVASLCLPVAGARAGYSRRMIGLLVDGLRYGARASSTPVAEQAVAPPQRPGA
jgi:AcrR family transcriptional regulator